MLFRSVLNMILCFFVTSLFSCTDHIIQEQIIPDNNQENVWAFPLIINVGLSNDKTRINYEDNGTNGVKQIWEVGDQFILYNGTGDSLIYTLSAINTSNSSTATFQANSDTPIYSSSFTAVYINGNDIGVTFDGNGIPSYNLVMTGQTQTITDSLSHLKGYDLITCENITNLDEALNFASKGTLLTFRLTDLNSSIGTLESLSITASGATGNIFSTNYNSLSDTASISLKLGDYDSSTTSLTAYIITPPFNLPSDSELSIILAGTSTKLRYVGSFTNSKDYVAATRYDFPISSYAIFQNYTIQMDSLNPYYNADNWETVYKPTGSGTADDPYLLSTAWNLAWLKAISVTHPEYNSTSVYYKLTTNIYVEDDVNWKQIGFSSVAFKGHFDGDGNEITNLNISNSSHNSFFAMTDSATIKNLTVKGKLVNTLTSGGSYFAEIGRAHV